MTMQKIALQLYSVRDALVQDFAGTLRRVAEMGYTRVETAYLLDGMTHKDVAQHLARYGLEVIASHLPLPVGADCDSVLEAVEAYGCSTVVWHGWPRDARYGSLAGLHSLAEEYNGAAAFARSNGLTLGLHNHWWEIEVLGDTRPYRFLNEHLDKAVLWEQDAYWTRVAGHDPAVVAVELGTRGRLLHIKDGPALHEHPMCALGTGVMPIPELLAASTHTEYVIIELDECATDMFDALAQSRRYLVSLGLS